MNERSAERLFQGVTGIGDDLIEEAGAAPAGKKISAWRRWGVAAACLCLAALAGAGVWRWTGRPEGTDGPGLPGQAADDPVGNARPGDLADGDGCGMFPGGITPVLRVGDALYEWTGLAQRIFLDDGGSYNIMGTSDTYLPEGYEPVGEIAAVSAEEPAEDLQLQAGFEAAGTVFVSEEYPAVVYVLMTTDWLENTFVRFASDELGNNELLSWQGRSYRLSIGTGLSERVKELPEGGELVGTLHFVGDDSIPAGDLETNCRSDSYGKPVEGREVYAVPGDDSVLYVYERQYWRGGDYPAWLACHLWER